jgi:hypothetical protein
MPSSRASATISSPRVAGKRSGCPLFDERDLAEIASPDFPGERLVACRNPALAAERARKREALLQSTERQLERIAATVARNPAKYDAAAIGLAVGAVIDKHKVKKHFALDIAEQERCQRDAHVVLDVVSQHAQKHVRPHAGREPRRP